MKTFKFFWTTHKWTGICLSLIFAGSATTGFLLLIKKQSDWIQPPTMEAAEGTIEDFITMEELFESVLRQGHPDFTSLEDIDRVDFRPGRRIHKVRSKHNWSEFQVDAVTGEVLSGRNIRRSDLIEQLHDGSFFGEWVHTWFMPAVSISLLFLTFSGLWLWIEPTLRRRRRRRNAKARAAGMTGRV